MAFQGKGEVLTYYLTGEDQSERLRRISTERGPSLFDRLALLNQQPTWKLNGSESCSEEDLTPNGGLNGNLTQPLVNSTPLGQNNHLGQYNYNLGIGNNPFGNSTPHKNRLRNHSGSTGRCSPTHSLLSNGSPCTSRGSPIWTPQINKDKAYLLSKCSPILNNRHSTPITNGSPLLGRGDQIVSYNPGGLESFNAESAL